MIEGFKLFVALNLTCVHAISMKAAGTQSPRRRTGSKRFCRQQGCCLRAGSSGRPSPFEGRQTCQIGISYLPALSSCAIFLLISAQAKAAPRTGGFIQQGKVAVSVTTRGLGKTTYSAAPANHSIGDPRKGHRTRRRRRSTVPSAGGLEPGSTRRFPHRRSWRGLSLRAEESNSLD
jgi:hypothetical protein